MQKTIFFFFLITNLLLADDMFYLGSKVVKITKPSNTIKITEKYPELDRYFNNLAATDYLNDTLASFLDISSPDSDRTRYHLVKIDKKLKNVDYTLSDFQNFKDILKKNLNESRKYLNIEELKNSIDGFLQKYSKDDKFKAMSMIPISMNKETKNLISFSVFFKYETKKDTILVPTTLVFTVISNRLLYFYTYDNSNDIQWTKSASKKWIKNILEDNYIQ